MPSRYYFPSDDIQTASVFEAVKRRLLWLILLSAVIAGTAFAILSIMAPRYQSEAELAIVPKGASSTFADSCNLSPGPDLIGTRMHKDAINVHISAIQSLDLMEQIVTDLKLKDRPEFNSALGPVDTLDALLRLVGIGRPRGEESERDRVMAALRSRLEVYCAKESRFIGVRMSSIDPELAATIPNAIAETYRAALAEQGVVEADDAQAVLKAKIDKLTSEVAAVETEADRYRGQIDGFRSGAQNTGLNEQQMSELTAELAKAKAAREEAEARANSAIEMMKAGSANALADVQKSPLIQNLIQQRASVERQLSELSAALLPGHPRMRQLGADLAGLKLQLTAEVSKIVDSLAKDAEAAKGREDIIKQSLDDIKAQVVTNAPNEAQLRQLESNLKAKRAELENLQGQREVNRMRPQPVEAQIISKAQPASAPVFPKKIQFSALLAVASFMLGTAWTVTSSLFQGARGGATVTVRRSSAAARVRADPVLPARPRPLLREILDDETFPDPAPLPAAPPTTPPMRQPETELTALAWRLKEKRSPNSGHRTLITGENPRIDPGDEALELVKAIEQSGPQAILVDWSPSGMGVANATGFETKRGMNDLLCGNANFEDVIRRLPGSTAHAITSGMTIDVPESGLNPDQLNLILDALDEAYDHIVVVSRYEEARRLFETIEGRFDAGILVAAPGRRTQVIDEPPGTFLGFEVADIDVILYERPATEVSSVAHRIALATQQRAAPAVRPA
jgi:uncharacterized protein involved in exopolysaccharide biosynthesis